MACEGATCLQPFAPLACLGKREEEREGCDDRRCCKHAAVPGISMLGKQGHPDNDTTTDNEFQDNEFQERVEIIHPVECFAGGDK